jgi:Fe-S-cluster containining protein
MFKFKCNTCGDCCKYYKIIINFYDALTIFHNLKVKFNETFYFIHKDELIEDSIYDYLEIENNLYVLGLISDKTNGCIFQKNNKCSIHSIKPSVCYFYPVGFDYNKKKFKIKKYNICNGDFDNEYTDFPDIENRLKEYESDYFWHNEIVKFWNTYYGKSKTKKDFIIFFYESLYPIFLQREFPETNLQLSVSGVKSCKF